MSDVRMVRELDAGPEQVWRSWTDPGEFVAWIWPASFEAEATIDARPGGRYRLRSDARDMGVSGKFVAVEPPRRLVFTWEWDGEPGQTTVTVDLSPSGTGTRLTLVHAGFTTAEARADHQQGWEDCLERLPGRPAGSPADPAPAS